MRFPIPPAMIRVNAQRMVVFFLTVTSRTNKMMIIIAEMTVRAVVLSAKEPNAAPVFL